MKLGLTDYQENAVNDLVSHIRGARTSAGSTKHAFVISAPTGSGKTAIVTAAMERILAGDEQSEGDPDATFLWVTDAPELNEQSKKKILTTSEVFSPQRIETVDVGFDRPTFERGKLYFLNTQKLGQATTFTRRDDNRTHSLWDTISRTAAERPGNFYLIIDEAQKGLGKRTRKAVKEQETIVTKLIVGGNGTVAPALLVGISATPKRFNDLLETATDRVRWPTNVDPEEVRDSGLIKDEIVLWHTHKNGRSEWAMLAHAAEQLKSYDAAWVDFSAREIREQVKPILVIQVTDGTGKKFTNTDLDRVIIELEGVLGNIPSEAIAHCFQDAGALEVGSNRTIRKIAPSDIQEDPDVRVVIFKMALNTGWDCPRAEVMMSFRRAVDYTYIAQLVGRMVRTPLAERILSDEFLNSVSLYLPNWNEEALERVINHLTNSDDAIPTVIDRGENRFTYERARRSRELFEAATGLPTYPSRRANKDSNVKRLMQLARYLANDDIDAGAIDKARDLILATLEENRKRLSKRMRKLMEAVQRADLVEVRFEIGVPTAEPNVTLDGDADDTQITHNIHLLEQDIRELFGDMGRRLGAGLHVEYVQNRTSAKRQAPSVTEARAELCALMADKETLESLEKAAGQAVRTWWRKHHTSRQALSPERQADYARVNRMAAAPEAEDLFLPQRTTTTKGARAYKKHLFVDANGDFHPSPTLNTWEQMALHEEAKSKDFRGWFRNPVRRDYSLGINYTDVGIESVMYPDFLIFRSAGKGGIVVDVVEPHAPNQKDLSPKLSGLCTYAQRHGGKFGRIKLIIVEGSKGKERLLAIDVNDPDVRAKAQILTENVQIVELARQLNS